MCAYRRAAFALISENINDRLNAYTRSGSCLPPLPLPCHSPFIKYVCDPDRKIYTYRCVVTHALCGLGEQYPSTLNTPEIRSFYKTISFFLQRPKASWGDAVLPAFRGFLRVVFYLEAVPVPQQFQNRYQESRTDTS